MRRPSRSFSGGLERLEDRTLPSVQFVIDPLLNNQPIAPFIYGINQSSNGPLYANYTYQRLGGNLLTDWDWENGYSNAGKDFYFQDESLSYFSGGVGQTTLTADISNSTTTIPVADVAAVTTSNAAIAANPALYTIWIDNEEMQVTAVDTPTATATISGGGVVTGVTIGTGGSNYLTPPTVNFLYGGGSGATGVATLANGVVTGVTITNGGSGYTSPPTITFSGTLTVQRGAGGTTAATHSNGANVYLPGGAALPVLQSDDAQNAATLLTVPINGYVGINQADDSVLGDPVTTVTAPVSASATVIPVANAAAVPSTPYYIVIDNEEMEVTSVNLATNQLTVVRGLSFEPATALNTNDPVYLSPDVRNAGTNYLQTQFDPEQPFKPGAPASFTLSPDPNSDQTVYEDEFVNWVNTMFPHGETSTTSPIWFSLDNEPDLWASTHAEIQPYAQTALTSAIDSSVTTIPVANAALIAGENAYIVATTGSNGDIWIDSEEMQITSINTMANTITVVRAVGGTTAASHSHVDVNNNPTVVMLNPVLYPEILSDDIDYSEAIKSVEPNALVFGAVDWGWPGYLSLQGAPDADGRDWLDYYLQQMNQASATYGDRLLDVLDVHFYTSVPDNPADIVQAPRSLWDPTYVENSYVSQSIPGPIDLLPRLQAKINQFYPGTKLSISEYNFGDGGAIDGAVAEADALGIFGVQGVYAASEFQLAASEPYIAGAFDMYRDFDGNDGTFGDTSVMATTNDVADSSIYASVDSSNTNVMTLVAINKDTQSQMATMQLDHVQPGATAAIYQLTGASSTPQYMGTVTIADPADFTYMMPGYSVTTIRIVSPSGQGSAPTVDMAAMASPSLVTGINVALSVLGSDAGGEANLTYTWIATAAPAPVSFSANGTNAAQDTVATFSAAGSYSFLVTIANSAGYFATSTVSVTVEQTLTNTIVTPFDPTTPQNASQQFAATSTDQFGNALSTAPTYSWSASAGSITNTGLFMAPAAAGNCTITATAGGVQGSATVFVTSPTTITVSTPSDAALRAAVASANTDAAAGQQATIVFAASLAGDTFALDQGVLELKAGPGAVTIDGGGFITLSGANIGGVFLVDSGAVATLYGLTIEDGNVAGSGGGVDNDGILIINNCTLVGDSAGANGGGIDNTGTLTVTNSTLTANTAGANGGGIDNEQGGTLTLFGTALTGNTAEFGGGIDNAGTLLAMNATFSGDNAAASDGNGGSGGGINNVGALTLMNAVLSGNSASGNGGGVYSQGSMTVTGSTLDDNSTGYIGGGINNEGTMTVSDSTLAGNMAYQGGGICDGNQYSLSGILTLTDDTLTSNFAQYGNGGGIYVINGGNGGSTLTLLNTLVAGNYASANTDPTMDGVDVQVASGTVSGSYNLIGDGKGLTGISNSANHNQVGPAGAPIDPLLAALLANANPPQTILSPLVTFNRAAVPLTDNGGPTPTIALTGGSPAIGAGGAVTTLTGSIAAGAVTIGVADAAAIAVTPGRYYVLIDGEEMEVTSVNLTTNDLTVVRAINGVMATLNSNDPVYLYSDQRGFTRPSSLDIGAYQTGATATTVPAVTGITPSLAGTAGGNDVIISGDNLAGATAVDFGIQTATILSVSASQILVVSPAGTGTVDVTVTAAGGATATSPADQFIYETAPTVTGVNSPTGLTGGGTGVVITGTNLLGATAVDFGANPAEIVSISASQIVVVDPAGTVGATDVTVTTPQGTSAKSPADQFTYVATPSPLEVTTNSDTLVHDGISLRDAVAQANADAALGIWDTILFAPSLNGDTIALAQGALGTLVLSGQGSGTIIIDGGADITVSGADTSGVFRIDDGVQALLTGLTIIDGNVGSGNGGAVDNAGTLTLLDDKLSNNTAKNGGAIENTGSLTVMSSTLSTNTAAGAGGAIDNESGAAATVSSCTLSGNNGGYIGGAINNEAAMTVVNSTLTGNTSFLGGGINNGNQYGNGGTLSLTADTISDNSVTGNGGGVYVKNGGYSPKSSTVILVDSIVAGNVADQSGPDVFVKSGALAGSNNLIGIGTGFSGISNGKSGNQVGTSGTPLNPKLASLADNGGPTQTQALQSGSPAIGKGGAVTKVAANISSTTTAIPVANAAAIASTPGQYVIQIGSEEMEVTDVNIAYGYILVIRGINGVTASHRQNDSIFLAADQRGRARPSPADVGAVQSNAIPTTRTAVTSVSPTAGSPAGNTVVAIAGVNLSGATAVHFGTKAGTILSDSANLILAVSPAATAGTAAITVTTASNTSAGSPADQFTYLTAPTVTGISPATGLTGGGTAVIITGMDLLNATAVDFGGNPATVLFNTANEIVVTSPAATTHPAALTVAVTVSTLIGVSRTSSATRFTYVASLARLTVTTTSDALIHTGTSLRDAVTQANADAARGISDTIVFASSLNGATLKFGPQPVDTLELSGAGTGTVTINGGGHITISGGNTAGVFQIDSGVQAFLTGLTIIDGNAGGGNGGAVDNAGTLTLLDDKLSNNTATNGGAIENTGTLTVMSSTLSANTANGAGGAIDNESGGTATVSSCTLSGNNGGYIGGAINNEAAMTVVNSTLSGNTSFLGGGINNGNQYGNGGTLMLTADTISNNSVTGNGGGVYVKNGGYSPTISTVTLVDSIVARNTADQSGPDVFVNSGAISGADNFIGDGTGQSGIANGTSGNQVGTSGSPLDPRLAALANNGGPTQTMALQSGSQAVAAGGSVTTLAAGVTSATATTITVAGAVVLAMSNPPPGTGYAIVIDGEMMLVTAVAGNTLTVVRGYHGTKATTHASGADVFLGADQRGLIAATVTPDIGAYQTPTHVRVTMNPADQTASAGQKVTFTASAIGVKPSVEWQISSNGGASWSNIPATTKTVVIVDGVSTTTTTLSRTATAAMNGFLFRALFSTTADKTYTLAAKLTVT